MIVIPAIDIKDGKVVRLVQGKFDNVTEYDNDPVTVARHWESLGAQRLHVVDLDGAQSGQRQNIGLIHQITNAVNIPVQVGGGIRSREGQNSVINDLLSPISNDKTVDRVILGTSAALDTDRKPLQAILNAWKDRIAISIDCWDGFVALRGWTEKSKIKGVDLAKGMEIIGVKCLIYTDIAKDGMLSGPNIEGLKEILKAVKIDVIASGGISGIGDIQKLLDLKAKNLTGVITGKAIYEGKLDLKQAIQLCSRKE